MKEPESVTPPAARAKLLWARLQTEYEGFPKRDPIAEIEAALLSQRAATVAACADEAEHFLIVIGAGWRKYPHNSSDGKARERMCVERIRALSPSAPGEERVLREIADDRLPRIRQIAQGASVKESIETLFSRLLAISLEADGVTSESGRFV